MANLSPIQEFFQTASMKEKMNDLIVQQITSKDENRDLAAKKASEVENLINFGADIESKNHENNND